MGKVHYGRKERAENGKLAGHILCNRWSNASNVSITVNQDNVTCLKCKEALAAVKKFKQLQEKKIKNRVLGIIGEFTGNADIVPEMRLIADLHIAAPALFELATVLEGELDVVIADRQVGEWSDVQSVIDCVRSNGNLKMENG